jgi:hypothetical protein
VPQNKKKKQKNKPPLNRKRKGGGGGQNWSGNIGDLKNPLLVPGFE